MVFSDQARSGLPCITPLPRGPLSWGGGGRVRSDGSDQRSPAAPPPGPAPEPALCLLPGLTSLGATPEGAVCAGRRALLSEAGAGCDSQGSRGGHTASRGVFRRWCSAKITISVVCAEHAFHLVLSQCPGRLINLPLRISISTRKGRARGSARSRGQHG